MRVQPSVATDGPSTQEVEKRRADEAPSHARPSIEFVDEAVVLNARTWTILWSIVLLLIIFNAVVLALFVHVYSQSDHIDSMLWFWRTFFVVSEVNTFLASSGARIAAGFGVLSVIFSWIAVRMVVRAVVRSRLRRRNRDAAPSKLSQRRPSVTRTRSMIQQSKLYCPARLSHRISRWRRAIGVRGAYFDLRLLLEEWLELATQTIAAHSASQSISNVPLNLAYAAIIFANSISTFVMAWFFPKSLIKQRLGCVMADLVLDFLWGTLLPVWMYVPVIKLYLDRSAILEDLTSYSGLTREVQRILVTSWRSYALSIIPFCSSLLKLLDLQNILGELIPRPLSTTNGNGDLVSHSHFRVGRQTHGHATHFAHLFMPVYGLAVLITSLAANEIFHSFPKQPSIACGYRVHPWFSLEEACLQRKLNCTNLELVGSGDDFAHLLDRFDSKSLAEIHFLDCSALEITSSLHQFQYLMSIVAVNSTIVAWDANASLSDAFFLDLRNVQLYDVAFGEDPVGLTGHVAPTLEWIHLQHIDGERILPLVGDHWRRLQTFSCQDCGLTTFPPIMYTFTRLEVFSLALNDLVEIPNDWLEGNRLQLQMFWLDGNWRLTELPDSLWRQAATAGIFSAAWTNLSVVPDWVAGVAFPGFRVTAAGTPLCDGTMVLAPQAQAITSCGSVF